MVPEEHGGGMVDARKWSELRYQSQQVFLLNLILQKKISYLYEATYLREDEKIQPTELPTVNPYSAYKKPLLSPLKSIRSLIQNSPKQVREYVQASKFDSHLITGDTTEKFVNLEIPPKFPKEWSDAGYTHIHFGAIRLALNSHGTEGKPVVARIALLDSRYLKYQDACIVTIEATLNSSLVMVTLFPNFTMSLHDPNLLTALKVQIQIVGAPQVASSTTLHYQIVYRIQDHAFNFSKHGTGDSLLISVNTQDQPHCIHVPRQISKNELIKLLPEKWITNYEMLHEHDQPIQSTKSQITSKGDGTTEIKFDHSHLQRPETQSVFLTMLMMQPVPDPNEGHIPMDSDCCCGLCEPGSERKLIESFTDERRPQYMFKDTKTGHCPWALNYSCELCADDRFAAWIDSLDKEASKPSKRKSKKKSTQDEFYERYKNGNPSIGPLGEDNGKFLYLVDYSTKLPQRQKLPENLRDTRPFFPSKSSSSCILKNDPQKNPFPQPCYKQIRKWVKKNPFLEIFETPKTTSVCMYQPPDTTYDQEFPHLQEFTNTGYSHNLKIPTKIQADESGKPTKVSTAKATLNWQTENAVAQNKVLKKIDSKVTQLDSRMAFAESKLHENTKMVKELIILLQKRLKEVASETATPGQDFFSHMAQRDKEIQKLKDQIKNLKETGKIPTPEMNHRDSDAELFLFPSVRQDLNTPIRIIHQHFVRNPDDLLNIKRKEFFKRKCCSYSKKDLSKYFKIMTKLFCLLGLNNNLKPVILASIPDPLQVVVNQALQRQNKDILSLTAGEFNKKFLLLLKIFATEERYSKTIFMETKEFIKLVMIHI
ncbi:hypothetical protein J1N35_012648 [Gossypium stocksii]|uniref:Uncharacterized protein n=1 Tax=Gossypium stocksii TaxID=47602 RepID=A0A9D3W7C7_9ROSI|nr:hypothetical protein J1N35_012648 [Gossypium stocksii]